MAFENDGCLMAVETGGWFLTYVEIIGRFSTSVEIVGW